MKKACKASLCLALSLFLSLAAVPVASAEETGDVLSGEATIVREEISMRGEYEKHYLCSDGSYLAVSYPEPIHYLEDGVWKEINNTLRASADEADYTTLTNRAGLYDVAFSEKPADALVTMESEGYTLSWSISATGVQTLSAAAQDRSMQVVAAQEALSAEADALTAGLSMSTVVLDELLRDTSLQYTVLPRTVKEDIVLESTAAPASYTVTFECEGLTATLQDDDTIIFADAAGDTVFTVAAPYMYDSEDEFSTAIEQTLTATDDGYLLTLTPDRDWLLDEQRAYPVTIDPSVTVDNSSSNVLDTYTYPGDTQVHNNESYLYFGNRSVNGTRKSHEVYFKNKTWPVLPSGATVTQAYMIFNLTSTTSTAHPINVYPCAQNWTSGALTWNTRPATITSGSYVIGTNIQPDLGNKRYVIDLKEAIQRIQNGVANYGLMFRYTSSTVQDHNRVFSSETSNRPSLTIYYNT